MASTKKAPAVAAARAGWRDGPADHIQVLQKVEAVPGGVNAYRRDPGVIAIEKHRRCPFCDGGHRLHRHGHYGRYVVLPAGAERVAVQRLLCRATGRTVSLLPEFCLPRRHPGPAVLGLLLHGFVFLGRSMEAIVQRSRIPIDPKTGWSLLRRLRSQFDSVGAYLSGVLHPLPELPEHVPRREVPLSWHVGWLLHGFADPCTALTLHARQFHEKFGRSLA